MRFQLFIRLTGWLVDVGIFTVKCTTPSGNDRDLAGARSRVGKCQPL